MTDERKEQIWLAVLAAASNRDDDPCFITSSLIEAHDKIFKDDSSKTESVALENPFKGKMFLIKIENSLECMKGVHEVSVLGMKEVKDQTSTPGK